MSMIGNVEVNVGDTVEIHAMGVVRKGVVSYVCNDDEFWIIELRDPDRGYCYWKQRHDKGTLVSVTPKKK